MEDPFSQNTQNQITHTLTCLVKNSEWVRYHTIPKQFLSTSKNVTPNFAVSTCICTKLLSQVIGGKYTQYVHTYCTQYNTILTETYRATQLDSLLIYSRSSTVSTVIRVLTVSTKHILYRKSVQLGIHVNAEKLYCIHTYIKFVRYMWDNSIQGIQQ